MFKDIFRFCLVLVATFFLFPTIGNAAVTPWPAPTTASQPDKQWEISFSEQVDRDTVSNETIYVSTISGKRVDTSFSFSSDKPNLVVVEPPIGGYDLGETYILHIGQSVGSFPHNERLKNHVEMKFSIISSENHQFVQGKWDTTYQATSIIAIFNADFTSKVTIPGLISSTGYYSLEGSYMTLRMLGRTVSGEITKVSDREFYITSASGSVMYFTKQ
ncbi:hypothetical protein MKZ25_03135 [Solibacillus sp. FSL W7-1464]|uniref:hypothetical protein n=1 Tax=Solibacillus sp. FSL W7-1464 TaxID=2921706 RepID=UPI0030F5BD59